MATYHFDGGWHFEPGTRSFRYIEPGNYDDLAEPPFTKMLTHQEARQLVGVLEQHGYLTPRLDDRLRSEDLKITHRLLDLLHAVAAKG